MDIFNKNKQEREEKREKKDKSEPETKVASEIKEASGHSNLDDVQKSWDEGKRSGSGSRESRRSTNAANSKRSEQAAEAQRQKELEDAFNLVGEGMMLELANIPYDVWAFIAADESLRLTSEESKKLAQAYYLMAKSLKPDVNKPSYMILYMLVLNGKMIFSRLKAQEAKKGQVIEGETVEPQKVN